MDNVKKAIDHFMNMKSLWTQWRKDEVEEDISQLLEDNVKYVGKKYIKMVTDEWAEKIQQQAATKWLLFNIVTRIITHEVKTRNRQLRMQNSFQRLFYDR